MYLEFGWEDLTDNSKTWLSVSDLVHDEESFYKELPSKFSEKHYYSGLELTSEHKRWIDDFGSKLYLLILARLLKDLARRMNMVLIYELFLPYHSDSMIIREELMRPFSSFRCDTTRVVLPDLLNRTALSECLSDFFSLVYYVCDALTHDPEFLNARSTIRHPDYGQGRKPVYIDRQDPPTFLLRHLAWKTLFKVSVAETALDQVDSFVAYFKMVQYCLHNSVAPFSSNVNRRDTSTLQKKSPKNNLVRRRKSLNCPYEYDFMYDEEMFCMQEFISAGMPISSGGV